MGNRTPAYLFPSSKRLAMYPGSASETAFRDMEWCTGHTSRPTAARGASRQMASVLPPTPKATCSAVCNGLVPRVLDAQTKRTCVHGGPRQGNGSHSFLCTHLLWLDRGRKKTKWHFPLLRCATETVGPPPDLPLLRSCPYFPTPSIAVFIVLIGSWVFSALYRCYVVYSLE